jgi:hypothetical protein
MPKYTIIYQTFSTLSIPENIEEYINILLMLRLPKNSGFTGGRIPQVPLRITLSWQWWPYPSHDPSQLARFFILTL